MDFLSIRGGWISYPYPYHHIELLNCSVTSGLGLESTASIRIQIGDQEYLSSGIGNGGFDAFMEASHKVLNKLGIPLPDLVDCEVRIPHGGKTSALTECFITWNTGTEMLRTRGVHSNQVLAAMKAAIRMLNIQMHKINFAK